MSQYYDIKSIILPHDGDELHIKCGAAEIDDGAVTDAKLASDGVISRVNAMQDLIYQVADATNQIVYRKGAASATVRTLDVSLNGYDLSVDGTNDATARIKLSGDFAQTNSVPVYQAWPREIELERGHSYEIAASVVSGTVTEAGADIDVFGAGVAPVATVGFSTTDINPGKETFEWVEDGNALIIAQIYTNCVLDDATVRVTLADVTDSARCGLLETRLDSIEAALEGESLESTVSLKNGKYILTNHQTVGEPPVIENSVNGWYCDIDVSPVRGGTIYAEIASITDQSNTGYVFCDEDNYVISRGVTTRNFITSYDQDRDVHYGELEIPENAKWLRFSAYISSGTLYVRLTPRPIGGSIPPYYVATDGSDDNDGLSASTAFATIDRALEEGAEKIMLGGGTYFQQVNMAKAGSQLEIMAASKDGLPVLYAPNSIIASSEDTVSGSDNVHMAPFTGTFDNKSIWIFQDGIADASTTIAVSDRHPLQRGRATRCPDTRIVKCTATTVEEAIQEIQSAAVYKWFHDTSGGVLYFSRPSEVSAANPICASFGAGLFINKSRGQTVRMTGVGVKYMKVNLTDMVSPVISDCFCGNVMAAGAFQWDGCAGARLYRCEAFNVYYSTTGGDGFNAHSASTGDAFAKQTTCNLFDCWAHDCCDDGYSDHERCEISIYGGLFEHNGGGGVTPAVGSHCTAYNVLARYNDEADFFYTGNPASTEGGVGGQIACYGCVSIGNGSGKGYRLNGSEIQGLFVNCVCKDRTNAFFSESNGGTQVGTLINCSTINCSVPRSDQFTVYNGTPVM